MFNILLVFTFSVFYTFPGQTAHKTFHIHLDLLFLYSCKQTNHEWMPSKFSIFVNLYCQPKCTFVPSHFCTFSDQSHSHLINAKHGMFNFLSQILETFNSIKKKLSVMIYDFPKTYLHLFRHLEFRLFPSYWNHS